MWAIEIRPYQVSVVPVTKKKGVIYQHIQLMTP